MEVVHRSACVCVVDDLLPVASFVALCDFFASRPMASVPLARDPDAAQVPALRGDAFYAGTWGIGAAGRHVPCSTPVDRFAEEIEALAPVAAPIIGMRGRDWSGFSITPWAMPVGASFPVHTDGPESYSGGFVFFLVPEWHVDRGGMLLVQDRSLHPAHTLSLAVHPVPNRLVLLTPTVSHAVTRVGAGEQLRRTLVGFFG